MKRLPPQLEDLARRLVWDEPLELVRERPSIFLHRLMTFGTAEDVVAAKRWITDDDLRAALRDAPPGALDARSWSYWHVVLGIRSVPPLPRRTCVGDRPR